MSISDDELLALVISGDAIEVEHPLVKVIGSYAFLGYRSLATVSFDNAMWIYDSAFANCIDLTNVNCPHVTVIYSEAFRGCTKLKTASFPIVKTIQSGAFYSTALTEGNFPLISDIASYAFYNCQSLSTVNIPLAQTIRFMAFGACHNLVELRLDQVSSVTSIDGTTFSSTPIGGYSDVAGRYGSVFVPASLYESFLTATNWSSIASRIVSVPA